MARIEREFVAARGPQTGYHTPGFMPRKPIPNIGSARIDGERFNSREFMDREWQHIWTKTWNIGCRVSELDEPGAFRVHQLGKESLLFVRGEDNVIRGFFNVCQHRGNTLCQAPQGVTDKFKCPFHGWEWNNDGTLKQVTHPRLFPQFAGGVPANELGLSALKVDLWGGWVWFNMDRNCVPLREYLGEAGRHLETYELEKFQFIDYKTFEWGGNWKHAHDAFNESYHFEALHPEFIQITEGFDVPIELLGMHSRMINFNMTVSEIQPESDVLTPMQSRFFGLDSDGFLGVGAVPAGYKGKLKDIHLEIIKRKREQQDHTYLPYKRMNDEQLVHQYHYTFFPGTTITSSPESSIVFRYRPHATDPNYCYYDFMITAHNPPGTPAPDVEHTSFKHGELPDYGKAFAGTFDPALAKVLSQDGSNMETMQQGTASDGFRGMILGEQEVRLRHFHQVIDRCLMGDYPWLSTSK
jgi:phenylpropionate dioxygenase-like ring-hydroxylating dioxygenase large terminal subunit